ncbi:MAG: tRNA (guanosine(46)-N7)-methyltransferase TrmB [Proteobacteria bacterium]|nr:tRNA (guanosine(46)-N7)-methyltransferase TrmB [Pseudomonadota bacterium]
MGRREVLERLLPQLQLCPADYQVGALDPRSLFEVEIRAIWLEVGFGAGEHLAAMAQAFPDIGFIGCEPFINGVARLLTVIDQSALDNVRIVMDDAGLLLDSLTAGSIDRAFLLFPDPWPKRRHNKRRFIGPKNVAAMARVLADGAHWRVATDHMDYCRWILAHLAAARQFQWLARRPGDWRLRPDDWPATRYEEKGIEAGRPPVFLSFRRQDRQHPDIQP